ncbi:MAG: DUF86 domain-containing protein [Candidatus Cloacimonadota bacterium]|nr:DUF86 domain-containing protein [Candidatus Cloacimonadota bacterium]
MKKEIQIFIEDILESIKKIEEYTYSMKKKEFLLNSQAQDSVIRRLEIIGEAVKNISQDFRNEYSDIPWKQIAGMRDVLIHGYFGVNMERVWVVVKRDLPHLKFHITNILNKLSQR